MDANTTAAAFRCPRRDESWMGRSKAGNLDSWGKFDGRSSCSYCGSISPDELFGAIEAGAEIGPTDKNYKVYVSLPHPEAGKPCVLSSANFEQRGEGWVQITAENRGTLPLDEWQRKNWDDGHWVQVAPRPPLADAKFYFQHLGVEGQQRFIDLLNAKKMKLGYPGHFYRLPFFCAAA